MAKKFENIENIGKLISDGLIAELSKKISIAEKRTTDILKKLSELENAKLAKRLEEERLEAERLAAEEAARIAAENAAKAEQEKAEKEAKAKEEKLAQKPAEPVKTETVQPVQPRPAEKKVPVENKTFVNRDTRPQRERPARPAQPAYNASAGAKKPFGQKFNSAPSAANAPAAQPAKPKNFGPDKKKGYEKTYVEKEKRTVSKRARFKSSRAQVLKISTKTRADTENSASRKIKNS